MLENIVGACILLGAFFAAGIFCALVGIWVYVLKNLIGR